MLSAFRILLAVASLLVATVVAAPLEVPDALAPRATACPTTSRWQSYSYSSVWRSTTTVTNGVSHLGSITSTETQKETRTINTRSTVYSPAVTTLPATTSTTVVATETATATWQTYTETVTSPGYAPASLCQVTTVTNIIPGTTHVTHTYDLSFATKWTSTTGHVTTKTDVSFTTRTITVTTPGSTAYAVTVTQRATHTTVDIVLATVTSTVYAKGCRSWACRL